MQISSLHLYPVKSCRRIDVETAQVQWCGLAGDRRWLVVDTEFRQLTQRVLPALRQLAPAMTETGLLLRTHDRADLAVRRPVGGGPIDGGPVDDGPVGGGLVDVVVGGDTVTARRAGGDADAWVSEAVGRDVRLVYLADPTQRPVDPDYARPGDRVNFADDYPVLLANTASLDAVNGWLAELGAPPVPMTRFRPNVVIDGAPAWAEDGWIGGRVRLGDVWFRAVRACARCVLTTIDQETGVRGRQPLQVLGRHRRFDAGLLFAIHLIPDGVGEIAIHDPVEIKF